MSCISDAEIASAVLDSDKTLGITDFIRCDEFDPVYFDRPYYLAPAEPRPLRARSCR